MCRRKTYDEQHLLSICTTKDNNGNNVAPCLEAQKALDELCEYFLGPDWYCVEALTAIQVNPYIVMEIEQNYKGHKLKKKVTYI